MDHSKKCFMDLCILIQFRMKCQSILLFILYSYNISICFCKHFYAFLCFFHKRRPDKGHRHFSNAFKFFCCVKAAKLSSCSPSVSFADSSPASGGAFGCGTNSAHSAVPLRGAIVSMGLRGVQGGLRGEIEIFPGPPAKKVIKMLICYLFVSTPQSIAKPSPGGNKGAFWLYLVFTSS